MSSCPNCKAQLSCGCQLRTATNGARVCATCQTGYEASLTGTPYTAPVKNLPPSQIGNNAPSNIIVQYMPPKPQNPVNPFIPPPPFSDLNK